CSFRSSGSVVVGSRVRLSVDHRFHLAEELERETELDPARLLELGERRLRKLERERAQVVLELRRAPRPDDGDDLRPAPLRENPRERDLRRRLAELDRDLAHRCADREVLVREDRLPPGALRETIALRIRLALLVLARKRAAAERAPRG